MLARVTLRRQELRWRGVGRPDPWALTAILTTLALLFVALFGDRLAPHEPIYFVVEHGNDPRPYDPGLVFPLGSDVLGRDLFSLILAGARTTLTIVLLGGIARVAAGVIIAAISSWLPPLRLATESIAELVSAIPATIVALVIVKVLVKQDTSVAIFIGSLLVMGWAGPYRIVRAELDRLASAPFTVGARTIGVTAWRMFWRHHLPHLVPVLAVNLSQQVVASLVLVAELGVLGTFVGTTRSISVEESLSRVITGPVNAATIAEPPEWGGLLASARTIESLWSTRWLIFVPGLAFALTALAVAMIGVAMGRRYARRELVTDLRGGGAATLVLAVIAMCFVSLLVPDRYAAARDWADAARADLRATPDIGGAFQAAGLQPLGSSFAIRRDISSVVRTGPASASIAGVTVRERDNEPYVDTSDLARNVRSFVSGDTGGGTVEAPLVFAGRGISFEDYVPTAPPVSLLQKLQPDFARLIRQYDYADDWANIDVHGKIVLLIRFYGLRSPGYIPTTGLFQNMNDYAFGPYVGTSIQNAIKRGAAGVIFVDPSLTLYNDLPANVIYALGERTGGTTPYVREASENPPTRADGVPVIVVSETAAKTLVSPLGLDLAPYTHYDDRGDARYRVSPSRDLGVTARLSVPLERRVASVTSYAAEVPSNGAQVLVWVPRRTETSHPAEVVLAALARVIAERRAPLILVDFDPAIDESGSASQIRALLKGRQISLVVVVDRLDGRGLQFTSANGDLIPAIDRYADTIGVAHRTTGTTARIGEMSGLAPFIDLKTVVIRGTEGDGDPRADAAALVSYLAGRFTLGAEELPR